jgi:holliday junction DNA helicase RuvA
MIAGVRGRLAAVEPGGVVVAVGPVDLRIGIPLRSAERLMVGQEIDLRTHLYVRENQIALFGFASEEELALFDLLLTVSGVGPKMALNILSTLDAADIRHAVAEDDARALSRAPGVGLRAATRIISELRGKLGKTELVTVGSSAGAHSEAIEALIAMGYPALDARSAVDRVGRDESIETVLREALGILAERS